MPIVIMLNQKKTSFTQRRGSNCVPNCGNSFMFCRVSEADLPRTGWNRTPNPSGWVVPTATLQLFVLVHLTLNLPTTTIVAQPFNIIKWQLKFNPVA